jgi:carbonic anhydrase
MSELLEGNSRFRSGRPRQVAYSPDQLRALAETQTPKVAIIACSDSRVTPEVVFDQPLGTVFASRVPGNVASDSAKWMLELAVGEFKVPLVLVLGHTGCLAVGQLLEGDKGGAGGMHRFAVLNAVYKAKAKRPDDLYLQAIEENVAQTVEQLVRDLYTLRSAILNGTTSIIGGVYDMPSGEVRMIEAKTELYGLF